MTHNPAVNLASVLAALEAGDLLTVEQRAAAAAALRQVQTLAPSAFAQRDRLVAECFKLHYGQRSIRDGAEAMAARLNRYAGSAWLRDRTATGPRRAVDMPFWSILRMVPRPLSAERIRRIVGQFEVPQLTRQSAPDAKSGANENAPASRSNAADDPAPAE